MIVVKFTRNKKVFRVVVCADTPPFVEVETVDVDALGTCVLRWTRASGFAGDEPAYIVRRAFLVYAPPGRNASPSAATWGSVDGHFEIDLGPA